MIPMLPHTLSNGICSLNAGCDRLALSCIMRIDPNGAVLDHEIAETVIHVQERMTYTSVKKILEDKDEAERERYQDLVPMFQRMGKLSAILRKRRQKRGSIDFDFPESKLILDEQGMPLEIRPYERNVATKLIEDFMLLANETVAEDYYWQELPFLYRTHEQPDSEKIRALAIFINNFGYSMHVGQNEVRPKEIQKLLAKVEGPMRSADQPAGSAFHEAGPVQPGEYRTFRTGSQLLYSLHIPHPPVSGPADPQDHQGQPAGTDEPGEDRTL